MASPPPPALNHSIYTGEHQNPDDDDEDDEDVDVDDDSTSSSNLAATDSPLPPPTSAGEASIAVTGVSSTPEPKLQLLTDSSSSMTLTERKPLPIDECRKLFQRLWTDEDEIELLRGFLDYTVQRGYGNSSHHDTTAFYDQIKSRLQFEFNKNQLVEKLRRLKKKYRNVLSKLNSGKDYVFKSPHDQSTFEISKKIWSGAGVNNASGNGGGGGGGELDEDEGNGNGNTNANLSMNMNLNSSNLTLTDHNVNNSNNNYNDSSEKKASRPRKRSRANVKTEEKQQNALIDQPPQTAATLSGSTPPNLIEDSVRTCLSPLFKELLNNAMNGLHGGSGGMSLNPMLMPLGIGGGSLIFAGGKDVDGKWRKQQILELEVYSKRLELIQDHIKSQLEDLRSTGS